MKTMAMIMAAKDIINESQNRFKIRGTERDG